MNFDASYKLIWIKFNTLIHRCVWNLRVCSFSVAPAGDTNVVIAIWRARVAFDGYGCRCNRVEQVVEWREIRGVHYPDCLIVRSEWVRGDVRHCVETFVDYPGDRHPWSARTSWVNIIISRVRACVHALYDKSRCGDDSRSLFSSISFLLTVFQIARCLFERSWALKRGWGSCGISPGKHAFQDTHGPHRELASVLLFVSRARSNDQDRYQLHLHDLQRTSHEDSGIKIGSICKF